MDQGVLLVFIKEGDQSNWIGELILNETLHLWAF